jgi:hypothetical protein
MIMYIFVDICFKDAYNIYNLMKHVMREKQIIRFFRELPAGARQ